MNKIEQNNVGDIDATNNPSLEPHRRGGPTADDLETRSNLGAHELQLSINTTTTIYGGVLARTKDDRCRYFRRGFATLPSANAPSPTLRQKPSSFQGWETMKGVGKQIRRSNWHQSK